MKKVKVNGIEIAYEDQGSGDQSVVLLHGFCGSSQYWKHVLPILSETHRVIVPDLRGHGQSETPTGPTSVVKIADDLKLLLDELQISEAAVLGHSLGGYVTLAFAEKYPQMLTGFSLIHSTARPDDTAAKENRGKAIAGLKENGVEPLIESLVPKLFSPEHAASMPELIEEVKKIGIKTSPDGAIQSLEAMKNRKDRNHVLRTAQVPVLLVAGEKDQIIPVEKSFSVQGPHIQAVKISKAGHMSMLEAPDELNKILKDFLSIL